MIANLQTRRTRYTLALVVIFALSIAPSFAQSTTIEFGAEQLGDFFTNFNSMFGAILPIALLIAGLIAGASFAFYIGNVLMRAFRSFGGRM